MLYPSFHVQYRTNINWPASAVCTCTNVLHKPPSAILCWVLPSTRLICACVYFVFENKTKCKKMCVALFNSYLAPTYTIFSTQSDIWLFDLCTLVALGLVMCFNCPTFSTTRIKNLRGLTWAIIVRNNVFGMLCIPLWSALSVFDWLEFFPFGVCYHCHLWRYLG